MNQVNLSRSEYVRRWGHATSYALLNTKLQTFNDSNVDGIMGYHESSKCVVTFGDPVCAQNDMQSLSRSFYNHFSHQNKTVVYVGTSENFANWLMNDHCNSLVGFGDEIILNPQDDHINGGGVPGQQLRTKKKQAINANVNVQEYTGNNEQLERAIELVGENWVKNRKGFQISLYPLNVFFDRDNRRWFYAQQNEQIVGALLLNRLDAFNGWLQNVLMITPDAPKGTSEILVLSVLEALKNEGCNYFSIGSTPAAKLEKIQGFDPFSGWLVEKTYRIAKKIFNLQSRQQYWKKFSPQMHPSFVVFSAPKVRLGDIMSIIRAFNVHS